MALNTVVDIAGFFPDDLADQAFRGLQIAAVRLVAEYGLELLVGRDDCALGKAGDLNLRHLRDVKSHRFSADPRNPIGDIEA